MAKGQTYGRRRLKNGSVVTLRPLRETDLDRAWRFANSLVNEKRRNPSLGILMDRRISRAEEKKFLDGLLDGMRKRLVVDVAAEADGMIVGNCEVRRSRAGDVRHVGRFGIAILPEYRGIGLGRAMIETLLDRAEKAGIRLVTLEAFATNGRALRLYRSAGFKEYGRLPGAIRRGSEFGDLVHMFRQA
ncbi:MAG TPA: GNAT family N-acetyltransferase [Nitrososphaerales archaeon]|nr:GNAT family N-acetyltransferase [Nitrososphaerales archaeon]